METAVSHLSALDQARKLYSHIVSNEFKYNTTGKLPEKMDMFPCDCKFNESDLESACGETSRCINRDLNIECTEEECIMGETCKNKRFQKCIYASIEIIKTEKKGFGLRAVCDIKQGQFIIEYCGEVIPHSVFVRRTREYSEAGVKHFYFMTLQKNEVIDAQKKGNWSRFMNHSCDPNCVLQKWVVGSGIRVGLFAQKDIPLGTELTFDYKFKRYGSEAQICYCGEKVCKGVIGDSEKTEMFEAEVEDEEFQEGDEEFDASNQPLIKVRRKKSSEDADYSYEEDRVLKPLDSTEDIRKAVKSMIYYTSRPATLKRIVSRLEITDNIASLKKFLLFHGLLVLKSSIVLFMKTDIAVCSQILGILSKLPIASRNAVVDSKIEEYVTKLADSSEMHTAAVSQQLLITWADLPVLYRIPKKKDEQTNENPPMLTIENIPDIKNTAASETWETNYEDEPDVVYRSYSRGKEQRYESRENMIDEYMEEIKKPLIQQEILRKRSFSIVSQEEGSESFQSSSPKSSKTDSYKYKESKHKSDNFGETDSHKYKESRHESESSMKSKTYHSHSSSGKTQSQSNQIKSKNQTQSDGEESEEDGTYSKQLRGMISNIVVKTMSRHKDQFDPHSFKKMARKYTHKILEKEGGKSKTTTEISHEKKQKIKKYVLSMMNVSEKVIH